MGKKKDQDDLAADFFGDADWMEDEEEDDEEEEEDEESAEHLPVAPTPKPPPAAALPEPAGSGKEDWGNKVSQAPLDPGSLANAPTLHFSAVPTIPPMDPVETDGPLPTEDMPTASGPLPGADAVAPTEEAPRPDVDEVEKTEPKVPKASAPSAPPVITLRPLLPSETSKPPEADAEDEGTEEAFGDEMTGEVPLVRSAEPSPARIQVPGPVSAKSTPEPAAAAAVAVAEAAPEEPAASAAPAPVVEKWEPKGDAEAWRDVANSIVSASATSNQRGALLYAAGRVHRDRLGDAKAAEILFRDAESAGLADVGLLRDLADALKAGGRGGEAVDALERAAAETEGALAAELLIEAAQLAGEAEPERATELAARATEQAPADYAAWTTLRDLQAQSGADADGRVAVLAKLAELSSGWAAAEAHLEAAGALLADERLADAVDPLLAARVSALDHGTVFVVLEDCLRERDDHVGLAALYEGEAEREGTADPGWWWLCAARAHRAADAADAADAAYGKAIEDGYFIAERERQAAAMQTGAWELLAASLHREAEALTGPARAYALYRLGELRERQLSDPEGALEAFKGAVDADPTAGPAADGVARLLARTGENDALRALWAARLAAASEDTKGSMHLRMAEVCESTADQDGAAEHYRKALGAGNRSVELAASEGMARVLHREARWADLGEHWARQATGSDDTAEKAELLYRGATVGKRDAQDDSAAAERLREILALEPTHKGALFELCMRLEALEDWQALASSLDDAGDAHPSPEVRAVLKYRAARVRIERRVQVEKVRPGLERAVEADPGFLPATWALQQAAGDEPKVQQALYRSQAQEATTASGASWASFAASLLSDSSDPSDLKQILEREPDNPGALAAMERQVLVSGDRKGLIDLWMPALSGEPSKERSRLALVLAALLRDTGQAEPAARVLADLADSSAVGRPLRAAARVAESVRAWDVAAALLAQREDREDRLQRARILGRRKGDIDAALPLYRALLDELPGDADVAFGAAISAARAGDSDLLAAAHQAVATSDAPEPARASSAVWAATLHEAAGRTEAALATWQLAAEHRKASLAAFRGVSRCLREQGDAEALVAHYASRDGSDATELAASLSAMGAEDRAAQALKDALEAAEPKLPVQLCLEQALAAADDWQGVYDLISARRDGTEDPAQQSAIDGRRRWILAEKLADTDAAWDLYRGLHDDAPADREVTEALARIAGARGETGLAIQYLKELAESAEDKAEAARYQRRVGEVYEVADDTASARQAFLDALDHQPDDREALDGLRRIAEREEDWAGLVQVHQREVGIAEGPRGLELKREIARVTEDKIGDPAVAMDAWRSVLEVDGDDSEALTHLMGLAQSQGEWGSYVEAGTRLAAQASGVERAALLRQVGVACQEQLERDDAIRYYEQAITSETPDAEAARRLEELYRAAGDWGGAIRALRVQADSAAEPADRATALERAALVELEVRHDRNAAAEFYEQVLEADAEHEGALRFLANHLLLARRFEAARPVCERLAPRVEEGQDLDDFDTRMELAAFHFGYGELLLESGAADEAQTHYARALELNPSHQASLERIGPLYTKGEEWKKAEGVYRQLLQLTGGQGNKEQLASVYSQLGVVERALGNQDKAYKRFNKALELHPNHVGALKGMAMVLEDRKDWTNLLNVFNNIIHHASVPDDVIAAYMTKGRVLDEQMERADKAAQHYQRSLDFDPKQPAALLRMGELAWRRQAWDEARVYAEKALALPEALTASHRPLLNLLLAASLQGTGATDDAEARVGDAKSEGGKALTKALGKKPLKDLEKLRGIVAGRLPK